jgi:VIT1/CCC1 family predicted Fe2+/Mn2+ transporter
MNPNTPMTTFGNKVSAQLEEANARIHEFEASANLTVAQGELDAITELRALKDIVTRKRDELAAANEERVMQLKSDIDSHLAALHASIDAFRKTFHTSVDAKAS